MVCFCQHVSFRTACQTVEYLSETTFPMSDCLTISVIISETDNPTFYTHFTLVLFERDPTLAIICNVWAECFPNIAVRILFTIAEFLNLNVIIWGFVSYMFAICTWLSAVWIIEALIHILIFIHRLRLHLRQKTKVQVKVFIDFVRLSLKLSDSLHFHTKKCSLVIYIYFFFMFI